jgi:hypothetical protein
MDTRKIADILRGTIDPNMRQDAETQLNQVILQFPWRPRKMCFLLYHWNFGIGEVFALHLHSFGFIKSIVSKLFLSQICGVVTLD